MAKVFISGPMTGYRGWNIEAFGAAEKKLSAQGHTVLNPASHTPLISPESISHDEYMRIALAMLDCCDLIYLLKGWQESKGANIELQYALEHRKMVEFEGG